MTETCGRILGNRPVKHSESCVNSLNRSQPNEEQDFSLKCEQLTTPAIRLSAVGIATPKIPRLGLQKV